MPVPPDLLPAVVPACPGDLPEGPHRAMFALWQARSPAGGLPRRADFDPVAMPSLLPCITIFDVGRDPLRFRVRLVGTAIVEATGVDPTGRWLDELPNIEAVQRRAEALVASGRPCFRRDLPLAWTHIGYRTCPVRGLPLADDGRTVDKLLYTMVFA